MTSELRREVALAGDWHGGTYNAIQTMALVARRGVKRIYHLGDFGIWPGSHGESYLKAVNDAAEHMGLEIWVTPGNHEDYDQIREVPFDEDGLQPITSRISLIPRGYRWFDGGRSFVSLGGGPSLDFEWRKEFDDHEGKRTWWAEEKVTPEDVELVAAGGHAEVMLAHDAPSGGTEAVQAIVDSPSTWSPDALSYAAQGRSLMTEAVAAVQPKVYAHGHYHVWGDTGLPERGKEEGYTRYLALHTGGYPENLAFLDLIDLGVTWNHLV